MPKPKSISASQKLNSSGLDAILDLTDDRPTGQALSFATLADTLGYVGEVYRQKLADSLDKADSNSSGALQDKTITMPVKLFGSIYSVEIQTLSYAKFIDEGVDGWAKSRGSKYKFKTKGVDPKGAMVESVKAYLLREGKMSQIKQKVTISAKESKRQRIIDASTKAAISTAYMIKRQGIKPTHYWRNATVQMNDIVAKEFAAALKIDIIENLSK
jgi:hypothetical protein